MKCQGIFKYNFGYKCPNHKIPTWFYISRIPELTKPSNLKSTHKEHNK